MRAKEVLVASSSAERGTVVLTHTAGNMVVIGASIPMTVSSESRDVHSFGVCPEKDKHGVVAVSIRVDRDKRGCQWFEFMLPAYWKNDKPFGARTSFFLAKFYFGVEHGYICPSHFIIRSEWCGTVNCRYDLTFAGRCIKPSLVVLHDKTKLGRLISPHSYVGISQDDIEIVNWWNLIRKKFPPHSVFLCGRQFCEPLIRQSATPNVQSRGASVFGINRDEKRVKFIIKGNRRARDCAFQEKLQKALAVMRVSLKP